MVLVKINFINRIKYDSYISYFSRRLFGAILDMRHISGNCAIGFTASTL